MQLKLFLEQTNQSWTLKPNREYVIGSGSDCDIPLSFVNVVSDRHLKLSFNQLTNTWHAYDLGGSKGTFVDNQPITDYPIKTQTKIVLAGGIFLVATPEGATSTAPTPPPLYTVPRTQAIEDRMNRRSIHAIDSGDVRHEFSQSKMLTWEEYVEKQVRKQLDGLARWATRFYLVTGFRNTPWVRRYGSIGFDAFDGYIIPDFPESAETIAIGIEKQLGQLKQYQNTDCFVAKLTDAHIADSETQKFLGVELFPVIRGGKADYRRFSIVSYHRVRTYLLVENYGTDLFVSWVTRFEPEPTPVVMGLWLLLASILTLILLPTTQGNLYLSSIPICIWILIYIATPKVMQGGGVVPKKANSRLLIFCLLIIYFVFISVSISSGSNVGIVLFMFVILFSPLIVFLRQKPEA
jgi:hypothetical protein